MASGQTNLCTCMWWEGWPRLLLTYGERKPGLLTSPALQGDVAFCRFFSLEASSFQNVPKWTNPLFPRKTLGGLPSHHNVANG